VKYTKPELTLVANALEAIQSSLSKGPNANDDISGPLTADSAYVADE